MQRQRGFTLIELLVTIAVLAVVAAIAAPNMSTFIVSQGVSSQSSELLNSLAFARNEATKLNANVVVIPATNSAAGWGSGWCVGPADIVNCTSATVIRNFQSANSNVQITAPYLQSTNRLTFRRDGTLLSGVSAQAFKITSPKLEATGTKARCIYIGAIGKASYKKVERDDDC
ncbi:GspH/FimT family pseudopilin [Pseudomonas sp. EL_65y_Pfl2_R95]|uniref:GspH/FimT family pseudopilin n=1 Tax=Pseudomonas sp. EL_65y_Pfl2_R95 TaxID=3088698 RepID=UPI0030D9DCC7